MIVAVLGGTFDPVHAGHVAVAGHVLAHGLADEVLVIPNWCVPGRVSPHADASTRLHLCRLAFAGVPRVAVDDREVAGGHPCFTVDTLTALSEARPGDRLRLVVGADRLKDLPNWRDPGRVLDLAEVIAVPRGSHPLLPGVPGYPAARVIAAPAFDHPVSATAIRAMLARGEDPGPALPAPVAAYIRDHRLYVAA